MKKHFYFIVALLILLTSAFTAFRPSALKISDDYSIKFDGGDPAGEFRGLRGTINFDPANLSSSKFDVTVDVATINTGNGMKNTHAKSAMWLDAEKYPVIRFTSESIVKTPEGYETKGKLSLHGVEREITLPFTFENNVFDGAFVVNRLDYNINTEEPNHGARVLKVSIKVPVIN